MNMALSSTVNGDVVTIPRVKTNATFLSRGGWWPTVCVGVTIAILAVYIVLVASNWIYLGWHDTVYFFSKSRMWARFWLTVWTSTVSTFFSLCIGIPAGYALSRFKFPCRYLVASVIDLPIVVSPAVVGAFLFGITTRFPFDWISDHYQIYIGRNVGASPMRTFFRVVLPMAKNGIIASMIVVWARAAAEWEGLMLFVGATEGKTDIMPFAIYLDWNGGMMGWVTSMSIVCILMAVSAILAMRIIGGRSNVW